MLIELGVAVFLAGGLSILAMAWLAKGDRLDTPDDLQAREQMLDAVERSFRRRG